MYVSTAGDCFLANDSKLTFPSSRMRTFALIVRKPYSLQCLVSALSIQKIAVALTVSAVQSSVLSISVASATAVIITLFELARDHHDYQQQ